MSRSTQIARNVAIVAAIALAVTLIPGGDNATDTVFTVLSMAFLATIGWFVYRLHRENQFTIDALSDRWRAVLYGALGMIALMIAGADELWDTGGGTLAWIALMALSVFGLVRVYQETTSY